MAINVSVKYNGGLLPDIILLTQCYEIPSGRSKHVQIFQMFLFVFCSCLVSLDGVQCKCTA